MTIRTFQAGDDVAQVSIYNEAGADLPKFKPATIDEVRRRCRAPDFDPTTRFYAVVNDRPVGYIMFQPNGRLGFPWCRRGHEQQAEALLEHALTAMKQRGLRRAFSAYRGDWPLQRDFLIRHGFEQTHEMINYALDLVEMPTPAARPSAMISPLKPEDIPTILALGQGVLRITDSIELENYFFHNPYFPPDAAFVLRSKSDEVPVAIGMLVTHQSYAHPKQIDAAMPCFRLGAFGTEGMTTKRVNGLFSFLALDNRDLTPCGLDLLGYATNRLQATEVETFAAQVPSHAEHLVRFYKSLFRRQGSFPIFERDL